MMNKILTNKILGNQIIDFRKARLGYVSRAHIIREYCKINKISPKKMAIQFDLDVKEVYRYLQTEKFTPRVKQYIESGELSEVTACRVIYNVKDTSTANIDKIMEVIVDNKLSLKEAEELISELNDPQKKGLHLVTLLDTIDMNLSKIDWRDLLIHKEKAKILLKQINDKTNAFMRMLKVK